MTPPVRVPPVAIALAAALACVLHGSPARAQESTSTFEIGGQVPTLRLISDTGVLHLMPGIGVRVDANVSPRVAVETQLSWLPEHSLPAGESQGGRTIGFCIGARGKFISNDHVAIYGSAAPGLIHFTSAVTAASLTTATLGAVTHVSLTSAFGIEFYPSQRWTVHVEAGDVMYAAAGIRQSGPVGLRSSSGASAVISDVERITIGASYKPGTLHARRDEREEATRWEVGAEATGRITAPIESDLTKPVRTPALGLFASYRLFDAVDIDAAVDGALRSDTPGSTDIENSRVVQALLGAKAGIRRDRFGIFFKMRGGVNAQAQTYATIDSFRGDTFERKTVAAFEVGGVLETYVSRRMLVRMDAGDMQSTHGAPIVSQGGRAIGPGGTPRVHSIQISVGAGLRF